MLDCEAIQQFAKEYFGLRTAPDIQVKPLRGGLENPGVARVTVRGAPNGRQHSFVVKPLSAAAGRELVVHQTVQSHCREGIAPAVLGWRPASREQIYLFQEWISAESKWPWRQRETAAAVIEQLARLHSASVEAAAIPAWDYEAELTCSAAATLEAYGSAWCSGARPSVRPMSRTLERAAAALPEMRHQLFTAYGRTLIHGDAHPGNVLLRRGTALLIDWGRARAGSPLEDVSSWVQTLGVWEPEARRGHDTLLARYVRARDLGHGLDGHLRQAHWIAGASNALAGALRYHLFVISDRSQTPRRRVDSWRAVAHWLRIIRRADACWRA